jgi:hypothetical protein
MVIPASAQVGDLLHCAILSSGTAATPATASGWTQVDTVTDTGGAPQPTLTILSRPCQAGDPGSNLTPTFGNTTGTTTGVVHAYSGADTTTPYESHSAIAEAANVATHPTPSIAFAKTGSWILAAFGDRSGSTWTPPGGYSERSDSTSAATASLETADSNGIVAPTTLSVSGTATVSTTTAVSWIGALSPSAGAPTGTITPVIRSSAVIGNATSSSTSMVVTKPAGLALDDYLLAFQFGDADNVFANMTAPAGFSLLSGQPPTAGTNIPAGKIWGKPAASGDVAASNFTFNDDAAGDGCVILVAIQAGTYDTSTPIIFSTWTTQQRVTSMVQTAPSANGEALGLLLSIFGTDCNNTVEQYPSAGPAGTTLVNQIQGTPHYSMGGVYTEVLAADGATGTRVVSPTPSGITVNGWIATTAVVQPLLAASTTQQANLTFTFSSILTVNSAL